MPHAFVDAGMRVAGQIRHFYAIANTPQSDSAEVNSREMFGESNGRSAKLSATGGNRLCCSSDRISDRYPTIRSELFHWPMQERLCALIGQIAGKMLLSEAR